MLTALPEQGFWGISAAAQTLRTVPGTLQVPKKHGLDERLTATLSSAQGLGGHIQQPPPQLACIAPMFSISWSALEAPRSTELTPSFLRHQAGAGRPEVRDTHHTQRRGPSWFCPVPNCASEIQPLGRGGEGAQEGPACWVGALPGMGLDRVLGEPWYQLLPGERGGPRAQGRPPTLLSP